MDVLWFVSADEKILEDFEALVPREEFRLETAKSLTELEPHLESVHPNGIVADVHLPGADLIPWMKKFRKEHPEADTFFVALSDESDVAKRVALIESGVDEFIQKPFELEELLFRLRMLLQEQKSVQNEALKRGRGFAGQLTEMNAVDLIQTLEMGEKSAVISLHRRAVEGRIFIRNGEVWAAELGILRGEAALRQLLLWTDGSFTVEFQEIYHDKEIEGSVQEIVARGVELINEKERLFSLLPPAYAILEKVRDLFPDEAVEHTRPVLALIDGEHTIQDILDETTLDELDVLRELIRLIQLGVVRESAQYDYPEKEPEEEKVTEEENPLLSERVREAIENFLGARELPTLEVAAEEIGEPETEEGPLERRLFFTRSELQLIKHKLL